MRITLNQMFDVPIKCNKWLQGERLWDQIIAFSCIFLMWNDPHDQVHDVHLLHGLKLAWVETMAHCILCGLEQMWLSNSYSINIQMCNDEILTFFHKLLLLCFGIHANSCLCKNHWFYIIAIFEHMILWLNNDMGQEKLNWPKLLWYVKIILSQVIGVTCVVSKCELCIIHMKFLQASNLSLIESTVPPYICK